MYVFAIIQKKYIKNKWSAEAPHLKTKTKLNHIIQTYVQI